MNFKQEQRTEMRQQAKTRTSIALVSKPLNANSTPHGDYKNHMENFGLVQCQYQSFFKVAISGSQQDTEGLWRASPAQRHCAVTEWPRAQWWSGGPLLEVKCATAEGEPFNRGVAAPSSSTSSR